MVNIFPLSLVQIIKFTKAEIFDFSYLRHVSIKIHSTLKTLGIKTGYAIVKEIFIFRVSI